MKSKQEINLKEHKELIEMIAKTEFRKISSGHMVEYLELVNIGTQTLYNLFKDADENASFNTSYLSTAIKWAIRNEIRRRYKWYSYRNGGVQIGQENLREAVYKTILSIDEMATNETPTQIKDESQGPEEFMEFSELREEIVKVIKKLPQKERDLIESKFFKDKKLREISEEFNLSPSRVSRIIQSGLNKIKKELIKTKKVSEEDYID